MYGHYLKTGLRNLMRHKLFALINVIGLSVGLAAFLLIMLFVRQELSYDTFWADADRMHKVEVVYHREGMEPTRSRGTPKPFLPLLEEWSGDIEAATRILPGNVTVRMGDALSRDPASFVEPDYFDLFDYEFLEGDAASALADPSSLVLPRSIAAKYFPEGQALGKTIQIRIGDYLDFRVSGVVEDLPHTSHLSNQVLLLLQDRYFEGSRWYTDDWRFGLFATYLRLKQGVDEQAFRADMDRFMEEHAPRNTDGLDAGGRHMSVTSVALPDLHLDPELGDNASVLWGFSGIAVLILAIAIINFLNLSLARTAYRAREVAVRKVVGAKRSDVIQQFLAESVLVAFVALLIALMLVEVSLPFYNMILNQFIDLDLMNEPLMLAGIALLVVMVGLMAGGAHASFFAIMDPVKALKGQVASDGGASKLRTSLVVGQFAISIALMTSAVMVNLQTEYARSMALGFDANGLVVVSGVGSRNSDTFKAEVLRSPHVEYVGRASDVPTRESEDRLNARRVDDGSEVVIDGLPIDQDFFRVFNIELLAGRHLENDRPADIGREPGSEVYASSLHVIANRLGIETLGFESPEAAIGQAVKVDLTRSQTVDAVIVGVSDDFHFDDARNVIRPGIYYIDSNRYAETIVRLKRGSQAEGMADLQEVWNALFPDRLPTYADMPGLVQAQYDADARLARLLTLFTVLAMTISALGLYGLAAFSVERRTRELGVRKVLGARSYDLIGLVSWQFSKPVILGAVIALPVAYMFIQSWLEGFVYRIEMTPWPFVGVVGASLLIAGVTVASYVFKAARAHPVEALRYE